MSLDFYVAIWRGVTQFYRISKGQESFVLSGTSKGKVTNLKVSGFFFKKVWPQSLLFGSFWNSSTIISLCYSNSSDNSRTSESLNLWQKTSKFVWYGHFLEVPGITFSKISFPYLDLIKAVSISMIANSEKMKMKKSHLILISLTDFVKKFLPLPNVSRTFRKLYLKEWERLEKCVFI